MNILTVARSNHPKAGLIRAALIEYVHPASEGGRGWQLRQNIIEWAPSAVDTSPRALHAAGLTLRGGES
jgi:hypothetical protein